MRYLRVELLIINSNLWWVFFFFLVHQRLINKLSMFLFKNLPKAWSYTMDIFWILLVTLRVFGTKLRLSKTKLDTETLTKTYNHRRIEVFRDFTSVNQPLNSYSVGWKTENVIQNLVDFISWVSLISSLLSCLSQNVFTVVTRASCVYLHGSGRNLFLKFSGSDSFIQA